jgi:hypothetical protein
MRQGLAKSPIWRDFGRVVGLAVVVGACDFSREAFSHVATGRFQEKALFQVCSLDFGRLAP